MAVDSYVLLLPCSTTTGLLESPDLLLSYSIITISLHTTIILTISCLSISLRLHLYVSTSLHFIAGPGGHGALLPPKRHSSSGSIHQSRGAGSSGRSLPGRAIRGGSCFWSETHGDSTDCGVFECPARSLLHAKPTT